MTVIDNLTEVCELLVKTLDGSQQPFRCAGQGTGGITHKGDEALVDISGFVAYILNHITANHEDNSVFRNDDHAVLIQIAGIM